MINETIDQIISTNERLRSFWSQAHGWAPSEAADLLSESRLDWQTELSQTLKLWVADNLSNGELILAWTNLGSIVEGTLKLFLSVYYNDYVNDDQNMRNRDGVILPDALTMEKLKQFYRRRNLLDENSLRLIERVQQRRNAIHAYQNREIGNSEEWRESCCFYLHLLESIDDRLPYPDYSLY